MRKYDQRLVELPDFCPMHRSRRPKLPSSSLTRSLRLESAATPCLIDFGSTGQDVWTLDRRVGYPEVALSGTLVSSEHFLGNAGIRTVADQNGSWLGTSRAQTLSDIRGYPVDARRYYPLWLPPTRSRYRVGPVVAACSISRWKSSPRAREMRRLKRNVYSSRQ